MDTSEKYIEMCIKAEDIWKNNKPAMGDFVASTTVLLVRVGLDAREYNFTYLKQLGFNRGKYAEDVWLPTQSQLQEMVLTGNTTATELVNRLVHKVKGGDYLFYEYDWSMEQLWLAFVMKELHNKTWDGKEWKCP